MKINSKITRIAFISLLTAGVALYATSCKKDGTAALSTTVTESDAAELTTDAVTPTSGGMVTQMNNSVAVYNDNAVSCGIQKDSTIVFASVAGASPSYNYTYKLTSSLTCSGLVASQLTFNYTGTGSYDGLRISSKDNVTGGFVMTGLTAGSQQYLFNTSYLRNGTSTSKILNQHSFTSVVNITGTSIAVDKTTQQIVSGTATVTITATSTSGKNYSFNGIITFLGGKKATLVLNSGASYAIQWN